MALEILDIEKPILSTIFETIYIKIPVQQMPLSKFDAISNVFPNKTRKELMFTERCDLCFALTSITQYPAEFQKCKLKLSEIRYCVSHASNDTMTRHKYNKIAPSVFN